MEFQNIIKVLIISISLFVWNEMFGQCTPPSSGTCEETIPFCSLDQMNGYSCNNVGYELNTLRAGCAGCCESYRTWWSFVSNGGNVTITFNVGTCNSCIINCGFGLVFGIWGDCQCTEEIACTPGCISSGNSKTYQVNLKPCKTYFISVDACCLCICDFTINTSGGGPPNLFIGHINNKTNDIIEPVCVGYCGYKFFVDPAGCQEANYEWTLDGNKVGGKTHEFELDFPDAGDFRLCVTATLGNPHNGFICQQQGPTCTTVKVRPLPDRNGVPRMICYEVANPGGYKWHSQTIFNSGTYRENYRDNNCCPYDSVVQFTVLPEPFQPDVYYITCNNTPYLDALGRRWSPCRNKELIDFPKFTEPNKCDSSILLTAVNVDFAPNWKASCTNGKIELEPNISILKACEVGESYEFEYRWYRKNDTLQKTISTDERLVVDSIHQNYCIDVSVKVRLGTATSVCSKTFCDTIDKIKALSSIENIYFSFCDSAVINGQTYTQSDTFTKQLKTVAGCDSIINTIINIQKASTTDINRTGCDSIRINGQTYFQSGDYSQQLSSSNGCDSVINIHAEIYRTKFSALFNSACDSVSINGQTYTQTGQYTQLLKTTVGCDSILRIDVDINKSSNEDLTYNACDSIDINGKVYKQSGKYIQKLFSTHGCDSILNLDIGIQPSSQTDISKTSCDSVIFNGKVYKQSGDYTERYTSSNGCDSIIVLHVNIPNSNTSPLILSRCDTVTINGILYNQSGNYSQKLISANGCDSILNIELEIQESGKAEIGRQECDSVVINNITYYQSGIYQQKIQTAAGCDSTLNIDLKITGSSSRDTIFRSCDSVIINGVTYTQSGIYQ